MNVVVVFVVVQETTTTIRPWSVKYYQRTTTSEFDIKTRNKSRKRKKKGKSSRCLEYLLFETTQAVIIRQANIYIYI